MLADPDQRQSDRDPKRSVIVRMRSGRCRSRLIGIGHHRSELDARRASAMARRIAADGYLGLGHTESAPLIDIVAPVNTTTPRLVLVASLTWRLARHHYECHLGAHVRMTDRHDAGLWQSHSGEMTTNTSPCTRRLRRADHWPGSGAHLALITVSMLGDFSLARGGPHRGRQLSVDPPTEPENVTSS